MRKKAMQEEIARLRDVVMEQGRAIVGLMSECEGLRGERDSAVKDIRMLGRIGANICPVCAHYNHGEGNKPQCITCIINRETDNFKWRGVAKEENK